MSTWQNAQVYQKQKAGDVVVSHRHATIASALIKTWSATTTFYIFKRWSCSAKYIVIDCKKCNFAIENDILDCRKRSFAFLRIWNQDRWAMYEPTRKFLSWTPISFFCLFNLLLPVMSHKFLSFYFDHLPIGIILRISWDKTLPMSPYKDQTSLRTCSIERVSTNNIDIKSRPIQYPRSGHYLPNSIC